MNFHNIKFFGRHFLNRNLIYRHGTVDLTCLVLVNLINLHVETVIVFLLVGNVIAEMIAVMVLMKLIVVSTVMNS